MKSVFRYLLSCLCISLFEANQFRCDYEYYDTADGWFKLHKTPKTWSEASYTCNLEGAALAKPSTDDIKDIMMLLIYSDFHVMTIHTARHPVASYNSFSEESEALALTVDGTDLRVSQNDYYPFICYKKLGEDVQLNECGTLDNDYVLNKKTGHCYKFHQEHASWYRARKVCDLEGGHLAIINSEEEAQAIREVFDRHPGDCDMDNMSFLGFMSLDGSVWKTLDGQTLQQAGYDLFSPGEPNNARGDEFCGSVGRNGLLFDDPCTRAMPFICEKKPASSCGVPVIPVRMGAEHKEYKNQKYSVDNEVY